MTGFGLVKHAVFLALAGALFLLPACDDGGSSGGSGGSPLFVAVGDEGLIYTTPNGADWEDHSIETLNHFRDIIYSDKFVAVGDGGIIYTSVNGKDWEGQTSGTTSQILSVAFGNGLYIAVGWDGLVLTSTDTLEWHTNSLADTVDIASIVYGDNKFVAVGATGLVMTTTNGTDWNYLNQSSFTTATFSRLSYGEGRYVLLITAAQHILSSPAAITASSFTLSFDNSSGDEDLSSTGYVNKEFIAVGRNSEIWRSSDGTSSTWFEYSSGNINTGYGYTSVAYGNGRYIMVGEAGGYEVSINGEDWDSNTIDTDGAVFLDITFANL